MKRLLNILLLFFLTINMNPHLLICQSFEKNVLIDIPGDNYDFDLLATNTYPGAESFITWINKNDSIYTVFLKRISPEISHTNIIISSDSDIKSNPKVALNRYSQGIKIVWQNFSNNYFQIIGCNYLNDSINNKTIIQDSLVTNPSISLSIHRIIWVNEGKIFLKEFYPSLSNAIMVDSLDCASPNIINDDGITYTSILYERIENENHKIYLAEFNDYFQPKWTFNLIADGNNRNSNFGIEGAVSFEAIENNISRIKYTAFGTHQFYTTENTTSNYKNPNVFTYPIPTSSSNDKIPYFVAFDSDSLEGNNEIFIKTFYFDLYDSLINISNMEGNDYKPKVAYIVNNDTVYVSIIWLHHNNSKTDIWIAKEVFYLIHSSVKEENTYNQSFKLFQNYPNPFNPITNIEYFLEEEANVEIKAYDILGNHIVTLLDDSIPYGRHKVIFDANNLSSGIYFYTISIKGIQKTKQMVLLR